MEITKAASALFNGALPIAGAIAGIAVVETISPMSVNGGTGIPIVAGAFLFGAITGFGPGERSYRYIGGGRAQVIPLLVGITFSDSNHIDSFLGSFFVATAVSITVQVILRELRHLPEAFLEEDNFEAGVASGIILVGFYTDRSVSCRGLIPVLEEVAKDLGQASVAKIDIDKTEEIASSFQVTSIPTLILFKDGKEVRRLVGLHDKDTIKDFAVTGNVPG